MVSGKNLRVFLYFMQDKPKTKKNWGERGSNSRPQDHSRSYETYALANCATTPALLSCLSNVIMFRGFVFGGLLFCFWGIKEGIQKFYLMTFNLNNNY